MTLQEKVYLAVYIFSLVTVIKFNDAFSVKIGLVMAWLFVILFVVSGNG
jgi:TRAP-type mannitol/chloroaromatic compound transport system permease small subunit